MKIYLCRKCDEIVPLSDLSTHRAQCGPDSEITLKESRKSAVSGVVKKIGGVLLVLVLTGTGIWLGRSSFDSIAAMRKIERVPATVINAVLPGEANLNGRAGKLDRTLRGPKSGKPCFYYRYLVERKERDSDGDTKWVTVSDTTEFTDFRLSDSTGSIAVRPRGGVDFSLPKSFSRTSGGYRYTEWRVDPNAQLFIFGYVVRAGTACEVRFDRQGHYVPLVSRYGEMRERRGMACRSIGKCWGGLVALAFAASIVIGLLRIHRLLVYFAILGLVIFMDLSVLSLKMMKADLRGAIERIAEHEQAAKTAIRDELRRAGVSWNGDWESLGLFRDCRGLRLPEEGIARLERIRLDLALAIERLNRQRSSFPERMLAPLWRIAAKSPLPLPRSMQAELRGMAAEFETARIPMGIGWGIIGVCLVLAGASFVFGFRRVRFKRCIENLPTSPTLGAVYGLSEFKGMVVLPEMEEPLLGPLTTLPCILYRYLVKERRGSGKKARWVTVVDEKNHRPFLCRDADGSILVDPAGARMITVHRTTRREGKRRYTETRLELNDPLYAIGECVIEPTRGDSLYLRKPEGSYPFILSNRPEAAVMRKLAIAGIMLLNVSFAAILLMALVMFGLTGSFAATDYLAAALAAPFFMALVTLVLHFNDLVFLRQLANRNWSNIDVSLQKRHDLIPNLEKMVKQYMSHESQVLEALAGMRSAYGAAASRSPETVAAFMSSEYAALSQVIGVFEDYPDLKADRQSALLMRTLVMLENEISLMRTGYNKAVEAFNTRIESFPDVIFARAFGFASKRFVHAESELIRIPPSVQNLWERDRAAAVEAAAAAESATGGAAEMGVATPAQAAASLAATGAAVPDAGDREAGDLVAEAADSRAVIYALLLNPEEEARALQLETIAARDSADVRGKTESVIDAVARQITDDVARLVEAEKWFEGIKGISPGGYRSFRSVVRELIEHDSRITLFEYALQKSMTRHLDAAFGMVAPRPVRYRDLGMLLDAASVVMSRLAHGEAKPEETARAAFDTGVALLNHEPKSDIVLLPLEKCSVAAFDAALEELAHATNMVQANLLYACGEAVKMDDDYTCDQALLLIAMADTFMKDRPDWALPEEPHDES